MWPDCVGAGADWEREQHAGVTGIPLSRKRLKLAKRTKEGRG